MGPLKITYGRSGIENMSPAVPLVTARLRLSTSTSTLVSCSCLRHFQAHTPPAMSAVTMVGHTHERKQDLRCGEDCGMYWTTAGDFLQTVSIRVTTTVSCTVTRTVSMRQMLSLPFVMGIQSSDLTPTLWEEALPEGSTTARARSPSHLIFILSPMSDVRWSLRRKSAHSSSSI